MQGALGVVGVGGAKDEAVYLRQPFAQLGERVFRAGCLFGRDGMVPRMQLEPLAILIDYLYDRMRITKLLQRAVTGRPIKDDIAPLPVGRDRRVNQPAVILQSIDQPRDAFHIDELVGHNLINRHDLQIKRLAGAAIG